MGMYTEIDLDINLSCDLRSDIKEWLYDHKEKNYNGNIPLEFRGTRVETLNWGDYEFDFEEFLTGYNLKTKFEIKNYESELELLVNTLAPYILTKGKLGTLLYEEYDMPGNIIKNKNEITFDYGNRE